MKRVGNISSLVLVYGLSIQVRVLLLQIYNIAKIWENRHRHRSQVSSSG